LTTKTSSLARTLAKLLIYQGRFQTFLKNQDKASKLCEDGLRLEKLTRPYLKHGTEHLTTETAAGNMVLGTIYGGDTVSSISYISKSLEIYQKLECDSGIGDCYNHLGSLNLELGNYKEAKQYFLKSIDIQKNIGNLTGLAKSLRSIGILAMYQKDFAIANNYLQQSLNVYIQMNDVRGQIFVLSVIGDIAYKQKDNISAERFCLQALTLQQANDIQPDVYLMLNLGLIAAKNQDTDKAVSFFLQACKTDLNSFDHVELLLHIGITFIESWQQEDKAAILLNQVLRNPSAIADHQKVAQEKFDQLSESVRNKALSKERDFQDVFKQMVEDLSAMQQNTIVSNSHIVV